jgi:hypothetical protein
MRSGRCLSVDTPDGIRRSFDKPLYAVRSKNMYPLLEELRNYEGTLSCYAFGDSHHLTLKSAEVGIPLLQSLLREKGFTDVTIEPIEAGIEDCFIIEN